jgi:prepilin-type N-terminal cleavage/methylation domain-containing protein
MVLTPQQMSGCTRGRCRGLTLIEILVVLAIVGLLLAITIPAVQSVRESARKTECLDKLHQSAIALRHHESTYGQFPKDNERGWSVFAFLLPELEQQPLFDSLQPLTVSRAGLPSAVQPLLGTELPVLWCPSYPEVEALTPSGDTRTTYLGPTELFTKRRSFDDILDGDSQTLAFGETRRVQGWSSPGLGAAGAGPNRGDFGSHHSGGVQVVLLDGQARFVSDTVDAATFSALCTPQGRDIVGNY